MRLFKLLLLALVVLACGGEPVTIRHIFWEGFPGQSNCWGVNPGGSGSQALSSVDYYDVLLTSTTPALTQVIHSLDDTHGKDFELGKALYAAGYNPIIVNVCKGSTYANDWIPGGTYYNAGIAEMQRAWTLIQAKYPNDKFVHHHITDQGEEDARYPTSGIPSLWYSNAVQSHNGLASSLGITFSKIWVNKTHSTLNNGTPGNYSTLVNSLQLQFAGSSSHFLDRDGYDWEPGGLHLTTAGYITNGQALAAMIIAGTTMGSLSTYAKNKLLDHIRNVAAYTPAATHYAAAFVSGVEVTGNGYARASRTNNTTTWPNSSSRTKTNGDAFTFPAASGGNWGTIDEIRFYDASSGGNELARHTLAAPITVNNGDPALSVAVGAATFVGATPVAVGGFADTVMHSALDLMFGNVSYTAKVTTYGSYWAGDPFGAGSQAGSRTAITQASTWGAANAGISTTTADIAITDQASGTYWAEHDASVAGNLLWADTLPAVPSGGKVGLGTLRTILP